MSQTLFLADPAATEALARRLAPRLHAGDCILLSGPIGAGKSHFARCLIQTRLGRYEDAPSPTFTLVQVYEAEGVDLWHADLYRLSHPDEVIELGLVEAFETAIALVEWPDRLGRLIPQGALHLALSAEGEGRRAVLSGGRPGLLEGLA